VNVYTVAERPDLAEPVYEAIADTFPEYNNHGDVLNEYWGGLTEKFPEFQFHIVDDDERPLARGRCLPVRWDGTLDDLPRGIDEAIVRGKEFLAEGAALVFIPGLIDRESVQRVVAELGRNTISVIGLPGALPAQEYEELGVARISYGPLPQRAALAALQALAVDLYGNGTIPQDLPALN